MVDRRLVGNHMQLIVGTNTTVGAHRNFYREGHGLGHMTSAEHEPVMGV